MKTTRPWTFAAGVLTGLAVSISCGSNDANVAADVDVALEGRVADLEDRLQSLETSVGKWPAEALFVSTTASSGQGWAYFLCTDGNTIVDGARVVSGSCDCQGGLGQVRVSARHVDEQSTVESWECRCSEDSGTPTGNAICARPY